VAKKPLDLLDVERVLGSVAEPQERRPVTRALENSLEHDPLIGAEVCGYVLQAKLGSGSHADVYRGQRPNLAEWAAVKVLRPELSYMPNVRRRFLREAQAIMALRHPNMVELLAYGELDERLCIVLELLEGRTLKQIVESEAPLDPQRIRNLGIQLASALAAVHAYGSIHRDVKPGNIMVVQRGDVEQLKLLDLGLVRHLDQDDLTRLTQTGYVLGTPAFMAPEQKEGGEVGPPADCYALGLVLFNMATGTLYRGPPAPMEKTGALRSIIERLIADDPKRRPDAVDAIRLLGPRQSRATFWILGAALMVAVGLLSMVGTISMLDEPRPEIRVVEPAKSSPPAPQVVVAPRPEPPAREASPIRRKEKKRLSVVIPRDTPEKDGIARALRQRGLRREDVPNLERAADPIAAIEGLEIDAALLNARLDRILVKLRRASEGADQVQLQLLETRYLQLRKSVAGDPRPRPDRMLEAEALEQRIERASAK
jgi:tRNA A-37 threonylcarbamoyl transferase component Bud32